MRTLLEGKKVYALTIVFSFAVIFSITFYVAQHHYHLELKDRIKENKMMANLLSSLIYEHQKAAAGILESYAQHPSFIDAVTKKDLNSATPNLRSLSKSHTEIDAPFITDQYGTLWANYPVDSKGFGRNLAYRDWYKGVSRNWKPYISSVYRLIVLEKGSAVAVSVPVFDRSGKVIGILSGAQRTAFFSAFIRANIKDTEKSITILDQEGNIIFSNNLPYKDKITKYPVSKVTEKAVAGITADLEIENAKEKGGTFYVSVAPVKGLGWSVIVGHEKSIILDSLYWHFIFTALTGFLAFVLLAVSLLYFRKQYKYRKTKELLSSEERYKILFDEIMDGICLADAETGIIVDCNRALEALVCRGRAELIGQPQTILHPSKVEKEKFSPTFIEHLTDKQGQIIETQVVTRAGDIREVEIKAKLVIINNTKMLQGLFHDITARKRTVEALEKSEERFRNLFNNAIEGVYRSTPEGRLVSANLSFARIFGYESPEEAIKVVTDIPSQMYADQDDRKKVIGIFKAEGYIKDFECRMRRKDGSTFWAAFNGRLSKNPDETDCFEGFLIDITERKQAEEGLRKKDEEVRGMTQQLWQTAKLATMGELAASIAHELNNPLATVGLRVELLQKQVSPDDPNQKALEVIGQETERMGKLVANLLDFSRSRHIHVSTLDVSEEIDKTLELIHYHLKKRNIQVQRDLGHDVPSIHADRQQLRQLFLNLFTNASDAMPDGGTLTVQVTAGNRGEGAGEQTTEGGSSPKPENECFITIDVIDTGEGIATENLSKIFDPFFTTKLEGKGTGLGLAICRRIVQENRGTLDIESAPGEGTAVHIILPVDHAMDDDCLKET